VRDDPIVTIYYINAPMHLKGFERKDWFEKSDNQVVQVYIYRIQIILLIYEKSIYIYIYIGIMGCLFYIV
jgi:hypothetical protein